MCDYTSVSLQVECVHVCALARLFTGLFVEPTAAQPAPLPPHSTQPLTRYLKYLSACQQSIERQPWNQCHKSKKGRGARCKRASGLSRDDGQRVSERGGNDGTNGGRAAEINEAEGNGVTQESACVPAA